MHEPAARDRHPLDERVWGVIGDQVFDTMIALDRDGQVVWRWQVGERAPHRETGHRLLSRIHPEDLPVLIEELRLVREAPDRRARLTIRSASRADAGAWLALDVTAVVLDRDPDGTASSVLICSTISDTTRHDPDDASSPGFSFAAAAPIGLGLWTGLDRLAWCNDAFRKLTGLGAAHHDESPDSISDGHRRALTTLAASAKERGSAVEVHAVDGHHVRLRAQRLAEGDRADVVISAEDVTAEVEARRETAQLARTFEATFEDVPVGLALVDLAGMIQRVNPAWASITGSKTEALAGTSLSVHTHPDDPGVGADLLAQVREHQDRSHLVETLCTTHDGGRVWVELRISLVRGGPDAPDHFVATIVDITHRRSQVEQLQAANDELSHQATHDHLTGLPNRALLFEHLSQTIAAAEAGEAAELLVCDVDVLKPINDTHGHLAGDAVLITVAERLSALSRQQDTVARFGGDEFVVIARGLPPETGDDLARRLIEAIRTPVVFEGHELRVTLCAGITSIVPGDTPAGVLARADVAVYEAKATRDCVRRASPQAGDGRSALE